MPLAQLYDQHAVECERAAERTEDQGRRAMLLKLVIEWREAAQQLRATEDGARTSRRRERRLAKRESEAS
jgi:hypothetical protein